jgi:hypothetical protein
MGSGPYVPGGVTSGDDVQLSALQLGAEIGIGGQGRVFEVAGSTRLVYKQYHNPGLIRGPAMTRLVRLRQRCRPVDRSWLDSHFAWPMCRVLSAGTITGFVMRRAERGFTWEDSTGQRRLAELQYLIRPPKRPWRRIAQPSPEQRRRLAFAVADLTRRLHEWNVIVGDISDANLLWTVRPSPDVYVIDCDGLRIRGEDPILEQADTPEWHDPLQRSRVPGLDADLYKTALAIARILCRDPEVRPGERLVFRPGTLGHREGLVRDLFQAAAGPPGTRPEAGHWVSALRDDA